MKIISIILGVISLSFVFTSCKNKNEYVKQVKEIDSLKVVLQETLVNFNTIDSAKCYEDYSQQFTYASYINANLKDTVPMAIAKDLQLFYSLGKNLVNYLAMKPKWTEEANTSIKQLTDLSHDLKNGSIESEEVVEFITEEKKEAFKIIEELKSNTELMRYSLETFSNTLTTAQETVKKLNAGVLPELIHPKVTPQVEND